MEGWDLGNEVHLCNFVYCLVTKSSLVQFKVTVGVIPTVGSSVSRFGRKTYMQIRLCQIQQSIRLVGVLEKVFTIIKEDIQRSLQISQEALR